MKGYLILTCSVAAVLAGYVHSKPHGGVTKPNHHPQQPDPVKLLATKTGETLPTFLPTESSTPEDEETSEDEESRVQFQQVDSDGLQQDSPEDNRATDEKETGLESEEDEESVTESEDEADNGEEEDGKEAYTSTESEIPVDLDYLSDGDSAQPQPITKQNAGTPKALENHTTEDNVIPRVMADYDGQQSNTDSDEAEESAEPTLPKEPIQENTPEEVPSVDEENHQQEVTNRLESETLIRVKKSRNKKQRKQESDDQGRGKDRKHRKMQSDQASAAEATQRENLPTGSKAKEAQLPENIETKGRKKNGKWNRMVGMNPVQIRATMELYPDTRAAHRTGGLELPADPCVNFRCKRGKTCTLNDENKPTCVCQDPSTCLPSVNGFDHVCGTDNKTYDTSCQLFATKCGLEGTKKGHRLHLDYTGSCKFIAPCLEAELVQFPLRMRDWLKNVLLQLNEHDSVSPGFLTAKQKIKVQKIFESERRLHQGNHPVELLLQDFEKNYNMYVYPVHWQFAQMDQHPSDRFLSHSELAPLRVPLVPMEHCTSVFFQKCDSDKDKLVSFEEWCSCFGIKEDDMDTNLLF